MPIELAHALKAHTGKPTYLQTYSHTQTHVHSKTMDIFVRTHKLTYCLFLMYAYIHTY